MSIDIRIAEEVAVAWRARFGLDGLFAASTTECAGCLEPLIRDGGEAGAGWVDRYGDGHCYGIVEGPSTVHLAVDGDREAMDWMAARRASNAESEAAIGAEVDAERAAAEVAESQARYQRDMARFDRWERWLLIARVVLVVAGVGAAIRESRRAGR